MENLDLGMKKEGSEFLNANGKPGFGDKKLRFQNQDQRRLLVPSEDT